MGLSWIVEQNYSCVLGIFKDLFGEGYVLDIAVEDVVEDEDILVWFSRDVVVVDHGAAEDAEGDGCFLVTDDCIENEGASGYDLGVVCQLGQPFEGHLRSLLDSVAGGCPYWRVVHEVVEVNKVL